MPFALPGGDIADHHTHRAPLVREGLDHPAAPRNKMPDNGDYRDDEQEVDQAASYRKQEESERPKNYQD